MLVAPLLLALVGVTTLQESAPHLAEPPATESLPPPTAQVDEERASDDPAAEHVASEWEVLQQNMQALAREILEHRIRSAQLDRLAEVYDARGNDERVAEVLGLRAREETRFGARLQIHRATLPPPAMERVETALLGPPASTGSASRSGASTSRPIEATAKNGSARAAPAKGGPRAKNVPGKGSGKRPGAAASKSKGKRAAAAKGKGKGKAKVAQGKPGAKKPTASKGRAAKAKAGTAKGKVGTAKGKVGMAKGKPSTARGKPGAKKPTASKGRTAKGKAAPKAKGRASKPSVAKGGAKNGPARRGARRSGAAFDPRRIENALTLTGRGSLLLGTTRLDVWRRE